METHVMSMRDENDGVYHDVVIAPDHTTARRLFAMRMLTEYERNLCDSGESSLDEFAPMSAMDEDWVAEKSVSCVSCGSGRTRPLEPREMALIAISPIEYEGKAHVCLICASTWIIGSRYMPLREILENKVLDDIAGLDRYEAQSLIQDEDRDEQQEDEPE